MPPSKSRFVTACQQVLALGVVLTALTPAAGVVTLDVVRGTPSGAVRSAPASATFAAYTRTADRPSAVPSAPVDPSVREVPLTAPAGARTVAGGLQAREVAGSGPGTALVSAPQKVVGYGAVGITWAHGVELADDQIDVDVRTRTDGAWSDWMTVPYDAEHGPDPGSDEAAHARPGTDPLLVGDVDAVQVRAATSRHARMPADMELAVVDPGRAARTVDEKPALDTGSMDTGATGSGSTGSGAAPAAADVTTDAQGGSEGVQEGLDLSAAVFTPKPVIYSRAQWGADESMRDKGSLHYYEVHAGFVHHTVNANDYTRAEVPGIIRSIYAYHTRSRGWSDIGYNFLVDRFGRIWEGRAGGIDRPVVGAHTLGYNDYSFAMSAIGNYDVKRPSAAVVQAYGTLFAWKLSLHGVDASSTRQWVGSKYFRAINGHRDAGQTACPGRYLYAKIPRIRKLADAAQRGWSGRELESNLAGGPYPDLIARRASDGRAVILPTGGLTGFGAPGSVAIPDAEGAVASPDLTGDGHGDIVALGADGSARVYPGDGAGSFGDPAKAFDLLDGRDLVTAAGDVNEDGHNDLVARRASDGRPELLRGNGKGGFDAVTLRSPVASWSAYDALAATGDVDGDGHADLLARDDAGHLWRMPGTGSRTLGAPAPLPRKWGKYQTITGFGDLTGDGRPDLVVAKKGKPGELRPGLPGGGFGHTQARILKVSGATDVSAADLTGDAAPDLLLRKGSGFVLLPNHGTTELEKPVDAGFGLKKVDLVLNAGDWDRDGNGDIIDRNKRTGRLYLRQGDGRGHFGHTVRIGKGFGNVRLLAAVGDMTGDGWPDLMGQPAGGAMRIYPGRGAAGLRPSYVAHSSISASAQVPIGRWDTDGAPDSLFRNGSKLAVYPGNGPGGLTNPQGLGLNLSRYDWVVGVSDVQLTGHPDLIVRAKKTGYLWMVPATAKGFGKRRFLGQGMGAYDLAG